MFPVALVLGWSLAMHWLIAGQIVSGNPFAAAVWVLALGLMAGQMVLCWCQKPFTTTPEQDAELDLLHVAVVVPCKNEAPAIIDRVLYSIAGQTRLPQHVIVVDDGSDAKECDYGEVREWWEAHMPCRFTWIRQENAGKRRAQAPAWRHDWDAGIWVTIDSDSALEDRALEEALKPFASHEVVSVTGLETAYNHSRNLLTRAVSARALSFQLSAMSAQSVAGGSVLINPGAFSLYRGWLIRKVMGAYLGETFLGVPVTLGDDTALTTFALTEGKAVHQPTAISMNVYPQTLSHHLRQWTRWMRASAFRTLWRVRYLFRCAPYGWVFTVWQIWATLTGAAIAIAIPAGWPATRPIAVAMGLSLLVLPFSLAVRLACVSRSDQGRWQKLGAIALLPFAALWFLLVLRQVRWYGMATCHRQGWVTRGKVEVFADTCEKVDA